MLIVTADSRVLVGTLTAADNSTNLVWHTPAARCPPPGSPFLHHHPAPCCCCFCLLTHDCFLQVLNDAVERIIREPDDPEPSVEVPLGLYLVRGDGVCSVGLVDEKLDDSINWTEVKGATIGGVKHI